MSIYNNIQICGTDNKITIRNDPNDTRVVFVVIETERQRICMEASHVRALAKALNAWEKERDEVAFQMEMSK